AFAPLSVSTTPSPPLPDPLSLHDALPILARHGAHQLAQKSSTTTCPRICAGDSVPAPSRRGSSNTGAGSPCRTGRSTSGWREATSEQHTPELQSLPHLLHRLLLATPHTPT